MVLPQITPRRVTPYILGGASGIHILVRMWRLSRLPASTTPLHFFLLKHSDIILVLSGGPVVIWHLAKHHHQRNTDSGPLTNDATDTLLTQVAHQLRQVFTALLIGLGLIKRNTTAGTTAEVPRLVDQLQNVVSKGIEAVNVLDPPYPVNGHERSLEA